MRVFRLIYTLIRWLILLLLLLLVVLFFLLNSPAPLLTLLQKPLAKQGISYGHLKGGLLTGFTLSDVNYENKIKAKKVALKVDFDLLKERVLYVDYLHLEEAHIDKDFLRTLLDNNGSKKEDKEGNITLPFDKVKVKELTLSLQNIAYENYHIKSAKIRLNNFETDMKSKHQGEVYLLLDSNVAQVELEAKMQNNNYDLSAKVTGEQLFLSPILRENNLTLLSNPKFTLNAKGDMNRVYYALETKALALKYQAYEAQTKVLNLSGYYDLNSSDIQTKMKANIDANVAQLTMNTETFINLNDVNNSLIFDVKGVLNPKQKLLEEAVVKEQLKHQNIQLLALPQIDFLAKGDMKDLDFNTHIKNLKIKQDKIDLDLKSLDLKGESQVLKGDVKGVLLSDIDSTFGRANLNVNTSLNYKDINNSLRFTLKLDFDADRKMKSIYLAEQNLTIEKVPFLTLMAKGDMKKLDFETNIKGLTLKQEKISLNLQGLDLKGTSHILNGDTDLKVQSNFDSSITKGNVHADARFNFNHLEESLHFNAQTDLSLYDAYLNPLLKEQNLTIEGNTKLKVRANGSLTALTAQAELMSKVRKDKITSNIQLKTEEIVVNLKEEQIKGVLHLSSDAPELGLNIQSDFSGNYMKPKELHTNTSVEVKKFNAFGLNLTPFVPLNASVTSGVRGASLTLLSQKLKLKVQSEDYEHVRFNIKSEKIYPYKLMELPQALKGKFVKLDLEGKATLSMQYFSLNGLVESNKAFKLNLQASSDVKGLDVNIFSQHLKLTAKGDLKAKQIETVVTIDSLKEVQEEFQSLYDFALTEVDGAVKLNASLNGEQVKANISSKKIAFEKFSLEELEIDAHYAKELLTLNKLDFKTTGFKDKKLNQHVYLNQKGLISLGKKRDVLLDIHPNILVKASGTEEDLNAQVQVESLALGYPSYGELLLSCDIDYAQKGKKKKITGAIFMDKMKLQYESKFLDPSQDNDVIVLSKKSRVKKERDSFLEDTFIDLAIYASDANYKTRDIDLTFIVDVKAKKEFGEPLGLLGKVKEINGRVEQAPKLFTVVDSNIVFKGEKEINPLLDIAVEYALPDVLITINIHGNAKRPKLTFSSEPPLPKKDILSYLLLGVSTASLGEGKGSLGREAQLFIMNQAARDLAYELELDRVFIKDDGTGEGYAIQVGKKINDKTMAIIENSKEGNSFILEYEVNKNIKVEVGQHQKTVPSQSIDLYFRKRFK